MAQEPDAGIDLDVGADASRTVGDLGPNDAADWGAANYFSGTYNFWSNRSYNSVTQWSSGYCVGSVLRRLGLLILAR
jgi:hypothetical protein